MSADSKPILVMFDIDGTLTQTVDIDTACFSVAVSELIGGHIQPNDWLEAPHMTDWGIVGHLHRVHHQREMTAGELRIFRDRFTELLRQTLAAHHESTSIATPGAHALLQALRESPTFEVSIATGACRSAAELKLKHSGLFDEGVPLASSDDAIARTDIMRHSRSLAADHQRVIYVGDGAWDAKASNELGWPLIGVQAHERRAQGLRDAGAATVVPDFSDTSTVLDAIRAFAR